MALACSSSNLIIETDCASVLEAFKPESCDRPEISLIAKDYNLLKPPDRQVVLSKINRASNSVAHELCQYGRSVLCGGVLQGNVPTCVLEMALKDCNPNTVI